MKEEINKLQKEILKLEERKKQIILLKELKKKKKELENELNPTVQFFNKIYYGVEKLLK